MLGSRVSFLHVTPLPYPPEVLEQKAREVIESVGYTTLPRDRDWSFFWNGLHQAYSEQRLPVSEYRAQLAVGQPTLVSFRYRQSGQYLMFFDPAADYIDEGDPPLRVPGDVFLSLDPHGRLRHIEIVCLRTATRSIPSRRSTGIGSLRWLESSRIGSLPSNRTGFRP